MRIAQIKQLFRIIGGKPAPKGDDAFSGEGTPFIKMKDLGRAHFSNNFVEIEQKVSDEVAKREGLNLIHKGSILLPRSGSVALNHRAVLGIDAYMVSHICALEVIDQRKVSNLYAYYYLRSIKMDRISKKTTGLDAITFEDLGKISIPLPPLDDLLKSVFLEMFGDPVRNEKGWDKKPLSNIATVRIGPFGSLLHAEDYISDGIPLVNPSHMVNGEIVVDESLTITEEKFKELSAYHLRLNDVVVARRGEIGRCAMVRYKSKLLCGTGSMFIRVKGEYLPIMLQFMIYRTSLKDYLESNAKGVTMKNLNSSILEKMQVIVPPINLQNQFATIVEKVEALKSRYQQSLTDLETLYGALSQKAFKGELDLSRVVVTTEDTESTEEIKREIRGAKLSRGAT
ncbi:MAG: restriction endonuclease subunit S [Desulfobulbus oligotrophicus]|jgi:restriction endonuclease S subunit|nr:restriction endonuclease subunit S [Desulfobulbus oligotrophicus]